MNTEECDTGANFSTKLREDIPQEHLFSLSDPGSNRRDYARPRIQEATPSDLHCKRERKERSRYITILLPNTDDDNSDMRTQVLAHL